eukprot:Selendium_serpulae@DN3089_c0_g1_i1.p1
MISKCQDSHSNKQMLDVSDKVKSTILAQRGLLALSESREHQLASWASAKSAAVRLSPSRGGFVTAGGFVAAVYQAAGLLPRSPPPHLWTIEDFLSLKPLLAASAQPNEGISCVFDTVAPSLGDIVFVRQDQ